LVQLQCNWIYYIMVANAMSDIDIIHEDEGVFQFQRQI
jgi:hypothetical protein